MGNECFNITGSENCSEDERFDAIYETCEPHKCPGIGEMIHSENNNNNNIVLIHSKKSRLTKCWTYCWHCNWFYSRYHLGVHWHNLCSNTNMLSVSLKEPMCNS